MPVQTSKIFYSFLKYTFEDFEKRSTTHGLWCNDEQPFRDNVTALHGNLFFPSIINFYTR